ncbi:MAG: hypothetical protein BRC31_08435 [Actinobacteria bacterium QS_5_72_10]|nr:MAG: hypothetical protein BRC31_08435 [Actinobacteria bacterium QS_5_72_10]
MCEVATQVQPVRADEAPQGVGAFGVSPGLVRGRLGLIRGRLGLVRARSGLVSARRPPRADCWFSRLVARAVAWHAP